MVKKVKEKKIKYVKEKLDKKKKKRLLEEGILVDDVKEFFVEFDILVDSLEGIKVIKVVKKKDVERYKGKDVLKEEIIVNSERNSEYKLDYIV